MVRFPAGSSTSPERSDRLWDPLMPSHILIHWVPGVKWPWHKVDHWFPSSTETGTIVPIYPLPHTASLLAQEWLYLLPLMGDLMVWTEVTGENVVPRQEYNSGHLVSCLARLIFRDYLRTGHYVNTEMWRLRALVRIPFCLYSQFQSSKSDTIFWNVIPWNINFSVSVRWAMLWAYWLLGNALKEILILQVVGSALKALQERHKHHVLAFFSERNSNP